MKAENDDTCYQISDEEEFESTSQVAEEIEESLLESEERNGPRGSYERACAWTVDATRALIHIRGPLEEKFGEGRHKRTTLWLYVTRQLHKQGYMYTAAKVQKKWHNILITYNKNITKKFETGYVHWEHFEDMFKFLQGKKAVTYEKPGNSLNINDETNHSFKCSSGNEQQSHQFTNGYYQPPHQNGNCSTEDQQSSGNKRFKYDPQDPGDVNSDHEEDENDDDLQELPLEITHASGGTTVRDEQNHESDWWKEYFDRKIQIEREKIHLMRQMHKESMSLNKMSLVQQEKIERIKIDAINNLTATLQKLVEVKCKNVVGT